MADVHHAASHIAGELFADEGLVLVVRTRSHTGRQPQDVEWQADRLGLRHEQLLADAVMAHAAVFVGHAGK